MQNKFKAFLVIGIVVILYFTISNTTKSFDDNSLSAYREIEDYFINQTHATEWDTKNIEWMADQTRGIESDPDSFTVREKYIIENLSIMAVNVGFINGSQYRDRVLEERYYDARDSVMQALFDGQNKK